MICNGASALSRILALAFLTLLFSSCAAKPFQNPFLYFISAANYSQEGVMILEPSLVNQAGKATNKWHGINPGFPEASDDFRLFSEFTGYKKTLPRDVTVVWQLAKLSDCDYSYKSPTPKYKNYVRKFGCTWEPIEGKVFHKTLNMAAIRNSRAYKRTGKPVNGSYLYGRYTLNIKFLFKEGHLTVKAANGQTQGFGQ